MQLHMTIPSMACSACAETITNAVKAVDGTAIVTADLKTKDVVVETAASEDAVKEAIVGAGYPVS
jgi:copper chaperone